MELKEPGPGSPQAIFLYDELKSALVGEKVGASAAVVLGEHVSVVARAGTAELDGVTYSVQATEVMEQGRAYIYLESVSANGVKRIGFSQNPSLSDLDGVTGEDCADSRRILSATVFDDELTAFLEAGLRKKLGEPTPEAAK